MAGTGGARPGAGRKLKADKYASRINAAEKRVADRLPELIDAMFHLAAGGYERVEEQWQIAATVTVGTGEFTRRAFPDIPDDQMVLVGRKVSVADKDRQANEYLINRIMGKPTERVEADLSGSVQRAVPGDLDALTLDETQTIRDIARKLAQEGPVGGAPGA